MVVLLFFLYLSSCKTVDQEKQYFLNTFSQQSFLKSITVHDSYKEETTDYRIIFRKNDKQKELQINNQKFFIENRTLTMNGKKFIFQEPVYFFSELKYSLQELLKLQSCIIVFEYHQDFESFQKPYAQARIKINKQKNVLSLEFEVEEQIFSMKFMNQTFQGLYWPYQTYGISYGQSF